VVGATYLAGQLLYLLRDIVLLMLVAGLKPTVALSPADLLPRASWREWEGGEAGGFGSRPSGP
jgi:hypothetical protein